MEGLFQILKDAVVFFYSGVPAVTLFLTWLILFFIFYLRSGVKSYALFFSLTTIVIFVISFGILLPNSLLLFILFLIISPILFLTITKFF